MPDAPLPDPEIPAPPRFLPLYDNVSLAHADRARIVSEEHQKRFYERVGPWPGSVLVDGFVSAKWWLERARDRATLVVEPLEPLAPHDLDAVGEEGGRLLEFLAGDATTREVRFE